MKLSKDQMAALAEKLSYPWGQVSLMCDGYRIDLQVHRSKGMTYRVMTYVNGEFKGIWVSVGNSHPEQKFLRKHSRPLYSPAQMAKFVKIMGKRAVAKDERFQQKISAYLPDFASGKAAITHLCKVCDSVEVLE